VAMSPRSEARRVISVTSSQTASGWHTNMLRT
jgi:hypothetical protein